MEMTQDILKELIGYDPESGIFTWRERSIKWFKTNRACNTWNSRYSGTIAGGIRGTGKWYVRVEIRILGKNYKAHRLAWLYMTGSEAPKAIDHADRDSTNNSWKNLRDGTGKNQKNLSMPVTNSSGICGVVWNKNRKKWQAQSRWYENGDSKYKYLGVFEDKEDAKIAVMKFRAEKGFDDGHGSSIAPYHR